MSQEEERKGDTRRFLTTKAVSGKKNQKTQVGRKIKPLSGMESRGYEQQNRKEQRHSGSRRLRGEPGEGRLWARVP